MRSHVDTYAEERYPERSPLSLLSSATLSAPLSASSREDACVADAKRSRTQRSCTAAPPGIRYMRWTERRPRARARASVRGPRGALVALS